jgi:hypothetical protein
MCPGHVRADSSGTARRNGVLRSEADMTTTSAPPPATPPSSTHPATQPATPPSSTSTSTSAPPTATSAAAGSRATPVFARWSRPVRYAAAAALCGSGLLWFVAELLSLGSGGDELAWAARHPLVSGLGLSADMLSVPLLFATTVVWFLAARAASPRLAWAGAGLLTAGSAAQGVLIGVEVAGYLIARNGSEGAVAYTAALDNAGGLPFFVFAVMFFGGAFLGILVSMVAVWRARAFPLGAILLIVAFQAAEMLDIPGPMTAISFVGLTWMAVHLVRRGAAPTDPAPRPVGEPV